MHVSVCECVCIYVSSLAHTQMSSVV